MRVRFIGSPDKNQRRERAEGEYSHPKPERPRRRGVPVRLDGRDDGPNARLRQTEPAVPPVLRAEVQEAATVRPFHGCVRPITATEKTHALARARTTWPWSRRLGDGRRDAGPVSTSPPPSLPLSLL